MSKYAITSIGNYYPLNTKEELVEVINNFKYLREEFKEEAAENILKEAVNFNVTIPFNNEIYRFASLKNEAIDKSKVFECQYFYVSSSDLDDDDTFTDELDRFSTSINKAVARSDVFKSYISVNPSSDEGKTFITNLYTAKKENDIYKFIKIATIEVTYYNKYTYSYEIKNIFDFELSLVYVDENKLNCDGILDESFNIERVLNDNENVDFFYLGETSKELLETLKDSDYGIPELKKFPMHDKKHVLLAIKFFNTYVGTKYEKELANNINKKIQEFKIKDSEIHMTKVNQFRKYYIPYNETNKALDENLNFDSFSKVINIPKVYHCSANNLGKEKLFIPKIPTGEHVKLGYEEGKTKRICVSTKIDLCLLAMNEEDIKTNRKIYVYTPVSMDKIKDYLMKPDTNEVEDCDATEEYWITKPTKMKLIGIIVIGKQTDIYSRLWHSIDKTDGVTHELNYDYYWEWNWNTIIDEEEVNLYNTLNPKKLYESLNNPINFKKLKSDYYNICKKVFYATLDKSDLHANCIDEELQYFDIESAIKNTSGISNDYTCHPEKLYGTHKEIHIYVYNNTNENSEKRAIYAGSITVYFRNEKDWTKGENNFDWEWETKEELGYDKESDIIVNLYELSRKKESFEYILNEENPIINMYRLDETNLDGTTLKPRIPDNYFTKNGYENNTISRVSFCRDIKHCLRALSYAIKGKEYYVHVPLTFYNYKSHISHPSKKDVPDAELTGEIWITKPVKLICIGKIRVIDDTGEEGLKFTYGNNTAELYDWKWEWVEKYKTLNESYNLESNNNVINEDWILNEGLFNDKKEKFFDSLTKNTDKTLTELIFGNIRQSISIDKTTQEFVIKGINFDKFLKRLKEIYNHRGISNLFEKNYAWWSLMLWKAEQIKKSQMKIVNLRCPIFFALEIYKMFLDLAEEYGINYYKGVAKNIYNKTWISNFEKRTTVDTVDLSKLEEFNYTLESHQLDFVKLYKQLKFMYDLEGYILSFEQGLGKTLTSVALAECLDKKQIIVVCPNTLKEVWANEIKSYYKKYDNKDEFLKEVFVVGNPKFKYSGRTKFFIVNQESIDKVFRYVDEKKDTMIIVDECHNFRNNYSKRTEMLLKLKELTKCNDNLMMSGTPIKATPDEIIPALRMIDPYFTKELADIYKKAFNANTTEISRVVKERFDRTIYRKTKKETLSLPNKTISNLYYKIPNESDYYITNLNKEIGILFKKFYEEEAKAIPTLKKEFNNLILKYSTASNSDTKKYLEFINNSVEGNEVIISDYKYEMYTKFLEIYVYSNPKLPDIDKLRIEELVKKYIHIRNVAMGKAVGRVLPKARANCYIDILRNNMDDILKRINENVKKTVIFTAFLPVANYIYNTLVSEGIGCVLIIGSTDKNVRVDYINEFKNNDNIDVLIATTQTMSTGVTLTEANQMFFFGTPYRSSDFNQACDRIHRIGQTNDVFIYKVLLESSKKNITCRIEEILNWSDSMFTSLVESYELLSEEKSLKEIVSKTVDIFKSQGFNPSFSKSSFNKFLDNKDSLCICGLGNEYSKINKTCSMINKEIKPLGCKISPDNYGTAFLSVKNESYEVLSEGLFINRKDLYLNFEKFDRGESNILLITGLSGSGKSTLGLSMAKSHRAVYIELDLFEQCYMFETEEQLKEAGEVFYIYLKNNRELYEKLKNKELHGKELGIEISKFLKYAINYCLADEKVKYILEGVQIYSFMNVEEAKQCPIIVKNTSALVSAIRRIRRSFKNGEIHNIKDLRNLEIFKMLSWYYGEEKVLSIFRKGLMVVNESATAGIAVCPSGNVSTVDSYERKTKAESNLKRIDNILESVYTNNNNSNTILSENPRFISPKTLFGYDRVVINKELFERYTEELKKLGFDRIGKEFGDKDRGEFIMDKNKNVKACILISDYEVNKIPCNILYFMAIDDSICDEKHTKDEWFEKLYNISINRYSVTLVECLKSDKMMMDKLIAKCGKHIVDDNGKKVIIAIDGDFFNDYKLVLTQKDDTDNEKEFKGTPIDETIVYENTLNKVNQIVSLNKLGTNSGVHNKFGLWNPIVKLNGRNYRERCEALIFDEKDCVYMGINVNRTRIPGGGTMPNTLIEDQLINECREECRINIKDIEYIGCYRNDYTDAHKEIYDKRAEIENVTYDGAITYLFIAKYDSRYTGNINAFDADDLINEGKFISIWDAFEANIKNEWRVALTYYLGYVALNGNGYNLYKKKFDEMEIKTNFLELVINARSKSIMTESYNILTEETTIPALKAKREKIESLVYGFFNMIDNTGRNAEKYKNHYSSLTDKQFFKEINDMLKDDKKNFYLEILPNINEPSLKKIKETADFLGLELDEYVYFRHDGDDNKPVRTPYKVPVGYLQIRRLQQTLSKKNTYSFDISSRNFKTGSLTGDNKVA